MIAVLSYVNGITLIVGIKADIKFGIYFQAINLLYQEGSPLIFTRWRHQLISATLLEQLQYGCVNITCYYCEFNLSKFPPCGERSDIFIASDDEERCP